MVLRTMDAEYRTAAYLVWDQEKICGRSAQIFQGMKKRLSVRGIRSLSFV